jgi:hypothetical protein
MIAAPVGVTISASRSTAYVGAPRKSSIVAGDGDGIAPCAPCTVPRPHGSGEHRIDLPDLMECDLIDGHSVHARFRRREALVHFDRAAFDRRGISRGADDLEHVGKRAMRMPLMMMGICRGRMYSTVIILTWHVDVEIQRADAALVHGIGMQFPAAYRQPAQFALQRVEAQAGVDERAEDHIAARAAEAVEDSDAHGRLLSRAAR